MFEYDEDGGECDPRTVTLIDHYVMSHVVRLAKERKFVHDGNTLSSMKKNTIIITRMNTLVRLASRSFWLAVLMVTT